jgi:hypothetical protein
MMFSEAVPLLYISRSWCAFLMKLFLCCNTEVTSVAFIGCGGTLQELLALEDRIGNVSTGLTAEAVAEKLKRSCYSSLDVVGAEFSQEYDTKCSICQVQLIS